MVVDRHAVVVLAAVNSAADRRLRGAASAATLNRSLALFFGLLLTMVIVLYDRFLGERAANPAFS